MATRFNHDHRGVKVFAHLLNLLNHIIRNLWAIAIHDNNGDGLFFLLLTVHQIVSKEMWSKVGVILNALRL